MTRGGSGARQTGTVQVRLQLFSILADCLPAEAERGTVAVELTEGATLDDLLRRFGIYERLKVPPGGSLAETGWQVLVNGAFEAGVERRLQEGDEVSVFPPMAGG